MPTETPVKPLPSALAADASSSAPQGIARRWRPAPALQATAALHLGAAVALAWPLGEWPWVVGALVANHAVLFGASLAPRSRLVGPNLVRLPAAAARRGEVAITFDDGPDPEVTPRVLDLLDERRAAASFFCIGERAAAQPQLMREIVRRRGSFAPRSERAIRSSTPRSRGSASRTCHGRGAATTPSIATPRACCAGW